MTSLSSEIRKLLDKEMRDKTFSREDFHYLADKLKKRRCGISATLHNLYLRDRLEIVKETTLKTGGSSVKTYKVKKGASFEIKHSGQIKKELCEKIKIDAEIKLSCFDNLDKVTSGWGNRT